MKSGSVSGSCQTGFKTLTKCEKVTWPRFFTLKSLYLRVAAKKIPFFLVVGPLRGGGVKAGLLRKNNFFEDQEKIRKKL